MPHSCPRLDCADNTTTPSRAPRAAMRVLAMVDSHANAWVIMAGRIDARCSPRGPAHHCLLACATAHGSAQTARSRLCTQRGSARVCRHICRSRTPLRPLSPLVAIEADGGRTRALGATVRAGTHRHGGPQGPPTSYGGHPPDCTCEAAPQLPRTYTHDNTSCQLLSNK